MAPSTDEELQALCGEWQTRLGLSDWVVVVGFLRVFNMHSDDCTGNCIVTPQRKLAHIALLEPGDHNPSNPFPYDPEVVLVHELLHVLFDPFAAKKEGSLKDIAQEQAINAISYALVALKRKEHSPDG